MAEYSGTHGTPGTFSYGSEVFSEKTGQTLLGHKALL
jgi:hypothetical protein